MKFFDGIKRALIKAIAGSNVIYIAPGESTYGRTKPLDYTEALSSLQGWVFAAVNVIGNAVARVRWRLLKNDEEVRDHPVVKLIQKPNPQMTRWELWKKTIMHLETTGNSYWYTPLNKLGVPAEIWIIPPNRMKIVPNDDGTIKGYLYQYGNKKLAFEPNEIIHLKYPHPTDPYYGMGVLEAVAYEYDTDLIMKKYQYNLLKNRAMPDVIIKGRMTQEQREALKAEWISAYRGVDRAGKVAVLNFPDVEIQTLGQTLKDLEYIAGRKFTRDSILHIWGIPPSKVGIVEDVNRANAETADYTFQKEVIAPRLELLREILQYDLIEVFWPGQGLEIDYENPIPEDKDFELKEKQIYLKNYVLTVNEVREELGYEPVDWGDAPLVPMNLYPLKNEENVETKRTSSNLLVVRKDVRDQHWKLFVAQTEPLERRFAVKMKELFKKQEKQVLENLFKIKKTMGLHKAQEDILDFILFSPEEWNRIFVEETEGHFQDIFMGGVQRAFALMGIEVDFDFSNPRATAFLRAQEQQFAEFVNETTWDKLRNSLADGLEAGESVDNLAERVRQIFDNATTNRAYAIARTEVIGATNAGTHMTFEESGVVEKKSWLSSRDSNVRPSHQAADGQVVGLNEPFNVGGYALMFPGDPNAPPEERIQCRCTFLPVLKEGL